MGMRNGKGDMEPDDESRVRREGDSCKCESSSAWSLVCWCRVQGLESRIARRDSGSWPQRETLGSCEGPFVISSE